MNGKSKTKPEYSHWDIGKPEKNGTAREKWRVKFLCLVKILLKK